MLLQRWKVGLFLMGVSLLLTGILAAQDATPVPTQDPAMMPTEDSMATPEATLEGDVVGISNDMTGNATITETIPFNDAYLERLQLPEGFEVHVFAKGLGNTRMLQAMPDGTLFITRRTEGDVIALTDTDNNGEADGPFTVVASDMPYVHGITYNPDSGLIYLATDTSVYTAPWNGGPALGARTQIIGDLPTGGQHPNRTMAFGPDGMLYITVGSTCNACDEPNPLNATIIRTQSDGTGRETYAMGLRNTIGFGWHPTTGEMWGFDHGTDWRGDNNPPEELNSLVMDGNYGWPWCYGNQQVDVYVPAPPPSTGRATYCEKTLPPVMEYTAHAAPIWALFYTGSQFPAEYQNDMFVAMRGSWNRSEPSGYEVVRVHFDEAGKPTEFSTFMSGFLIEERLANFGRIAGLAIAQDGGLFVSDDQNGVIYHIMYTGQ
jgi:glucose/arabinose dehydrogenase